MICEGMEHPEETVVFLSIGAVGEKMVTITGHEQGQEDSEAQIWGLRDQRLAKQCVELLHLDPHFTCGEQGVEYRLEAADEGRKLCRTGADDGHQLWHAVLQRFPDCVLDVLGQFVDVGQILGDIIRPGVGCIGPYHRLGVVLKQHPRVVEALLTDLRQKDHNAIGPLRRGSRLWLQVLVRDAASQRHRAVLDSDFVQLGLALLLACKFRFVYVLFRLGLEAVWVGGFHAPQGILMLLQDGEVVLLDLLGVPCDLFLHIIRGRVRFPQQLPGCGQGIRWYFRTGGSLSHLQGAAREVVVDHGNHGHGSAVLLVDHPINELSCQKAFMAFAMLLNLCPIVRLAQESRAIIKGMQRDLGPISRKDFRNNVPVAKIALSILYW
mmetsp:Transcript_14617/g.26416  ORF Transcript_14617/g.26416 Transcript_14617/m.26416 type:complete len:380 (+) Transcript_14617:574-1713(+)